MTTRTRYRYNYHFVTNTASDFNTKRRYCEYYSGSSWKLIDSTDKSSITCYGAPKVVKMIDSQYTSAEKAAIRKTGRRELKSKKALSWKANFSIFYAVKTPLGEVRKYGNDVPLIRIDNGRPLGTYRRSDFLEFRGLPNEARNYWGFSSTIIKEFYDLKTETYKLPSNIVLASYQKMCKDASMLGLHDQNIFTTIGELKDFKQTVRTVTKHVFSDKKYIADKYLGVNFGIIPFYQDMRNYIDNYNNFAPSLKKWNDIGKKGKILNKHRLIFKEKFVDNFEVTTGVINWPSSTSTYKYVAKYSVEYVVKDLNHMYFRAKPLKGEDENELIRSINGLSKPFTAAWNLIPFSFLVDWFVNVGDTIEQMEYQKPVVSFDILDCCYSVKFEQTIRCDLYHLDTFTGNQTYLGSTEKKDNFFNREPISASYIKDVIDSVGVIGPLQLKTELSGYQWSLAAALAVTNIKLKK